MYHYLLLLLFLLIMTGFKEGYLNYTDIYETKEKNCPQMHVQNYNRLVNRDKMKDFFNEKNLWESYSDRVDLKEIKSQDKSAYQMIQPFGYTKNELFDMTRLAKTDIPLPTDPDFFNHI
jgi:hypothetical protein